MHHKARKPALWAVVVLMMMFAALWFVCVRAFAQPAPQGESRDSADWVKPDYPTSAPTPRQITEVRRYVFTQASYPAPSALPYVAKESATYTSPEATLSARYSAMKSLNYDWWLELSDPEARQLTASWEKTRGYNREWWVGQWRVLDQAGMCLTHRVELSDYVILTYRLLTPDGRDAGGFELPSVLRHFGDRWYSTQSLAKDPLLSFSPWVSGQSAAEFTVR